MVLLKQEYKTIYLGCVLSKDEWYTDYRRLCRKYSEMTVSIKASKHQAGLSVFPAQFWNSPNATIWK